MNSAPSVVLGAIISLALSVPVSAQGRKYTVQIEAAQTQSLAKEAVRRLKAQGVKAYWTKHSVPGDGVFYRVRVGRFPTKAFRCDFRTSVSVIPARPNGGSI